MEPSLQGSELRGGSVMEPSELSHKGGSVTKSLRPAFCVTERLHVTDENGCDGGAVEQCKPREAHHDDPNKQNTRFSTFGLGYHR